MRGCGGRKPSLVKLRADTVKSAKMKGEWHGACSDAFSERLDVRPEIHIHEDLPRLVPFIELVDVFQ